MSRQGVLTACSLVSVALAQSAFAYSQEEVNVFDEPAVSTKYTGAEGTPGGDARSERDVRSMPTPSKPARAADDNQNARPNADRLQP